MRTAASFAGHPIHMMLVHFPMAFLMGAFCVDAAAAVGLPLPLLIGDYLLPAGLFTGTLAAAPGIADLLMTVRHAGADRMRRGVRHAAVSLASLTAFAVAWRLRDAAATSPAAGVLGVEMLGVILLTISGFLGGALVLEHGVGVTSPTDQS